MCEGRFWRRTSLSIGAPLGNLNGAHIPGTLKYERRRALGIWHLSLRELCEGKLEVGLLYW
jgi:hypothetical protein